VIVDAGDVFTGEPMAASKKYSHRVVNPDEIGTRSAFPCHFFWHPHPNWLNTIGKLCDKWRCKIPPITAGRYAETTTGRNWANLNKTVC
jgi:hypothetical protein